MRVRFETVRKHPVTWDRPFEIDADRVGHPDLVRLGPVEWKGQLTFVDPGYLLSAAHDYAQTLRCQRCLDDVTRPIAGRLDLLIVADLPDEPEGDEVELDEADLGVAHVEGEEVDLEVFLIEQIDLEVPMRPLCRSDCAGLCPSCGTNRNEATCSCGNETTDPRWEGLSGLKSRLDQ